MAWRGGRLRQRSRSNMRLAPELTADNRRVLALGDDGVGVAGAVLHAPVPGGPPGIDRVLQDVAYAGVG